MAGVGISMNKIYGKQTMTTNLVGFGYSLSISVVPVISVIVAIVLMEYFLGFSKLGYIERELFSSTVLYIFIFGLIATSPFNSVLSRYLSDVIYNETYEDVMPCFYAGLFMNIVLGLMMSVPFCLWEFFVGQVDVLYVFTGFVGHLSLIFVFYSMLYLNIAKDYKRISLFFAIGMTITFLLALLLVKVCHWMVGFSMLFSLVIGLMLIALLEYALLRQYFRENSGKYREVLVYFGRFWPLVFTNFLYTLGLYVHNFVYWNTNLATVVAESFVSAQSYDMATCLALFTNISSTAIFVSRVEMQFHDRYKAYSDAVIGGRLMDIKNAKKRMFRQLSEELMNLQRIQFIISVVVYLIMMIFMPRLGMSGLVMRFYPCLAAGYFILFIMYAELIYLYYFNDLYGALLTAVSFFVVTLLGSIMASHFDYIWYGLGVVLGGIVSWSIGYWRLRSLEGKLDIHIFCKGDIIPRKSQKPSNKVFSRYEEAAKN